MKLSLSVTMAVLAIAALSHCKTVTTSNTPFEEKPITAGKSMIYVWREDHFVSQNLPFKIEVDGATAGFLKIGAFLSHEVSPGKHEVRMNGHMGPAMGQLVTLEVPAGKACYLRIVGIDMKNYGNCGDVPSGIQKAKYDPNQ
jgi:hypothetical protein